MAVQIPSASFKWNDLFSRVAIRLDKEYVEQVLKISPTFAKMYASADKSSGLPEIITKRVRYTHNTFTTFSGLQDIDISTYEKDTVAQYGRATFVGTVIAPVDELALYQSPESLVNYLTEQYDDTMEGGKDYFGRKIWSGSLTEARMIHGLTNIIKATNSTSGTYASLSRNTNSWWRNTATSNAAGINFTLYDVNQALVAVSFGGTQTDYMCGNEAVYNQLYSIADSHQREPNSWAAQLGFTSMNINQIPFTLDRYMPTDRIVGINTKFCKLYVDRNYDFKSTPFIYVPNRAAMVKQIFFIAQTCCNSLRHQFSLYNLK